jgi:hypothetical protein
MRGIAAFAMSLKLTIKKEVGRTNRMATLRGPTLARRRGNSASERALELLHWNARCFRVQTQEKKMGRGLLLWLLGIPIPIIILIWLFGGLH